MFYRNLNHVRMISQVLSLLFLLFIPLLVLRKIYLICGNFYSLSIGELDLADPIMALQVMALTQQLVPRLLLAAAVPVILALILGKVFCSWVCPQNTFAEWIAALQKRWAFNRWRSRQRARTGPNPRPWIYWGIFAVLMLAVLVTGLPLMSYLSAPGIISAQIGQVILGLGIGIELLVVVVILVAEALLWRRFWCKYACPVGAGLALLRAPGTLRVHFAPDLCDCGGRTSPCRLACPLDLAPKREGIYPACFNCGLCVAACEETGKEALSFRFQKRRADDTLDIPAPAARFVNERDGGGDEPVLASGDHY